MLGKFASNLLIFHIEEGKGTRTSAKTFSRRFKPCGSMGSFPFRLLFYKLQYWILIAARASPIFSFLTFRDSLNENKKRIYDIGPLSPSINFFRAKRKKRRKRTARARLSPISPSPTQCFDGDENCIQFVIRKLKRFVSEGLGSSLLIICQI